MKLHLGCDKRNFPGWTNVDIAEYPHINYVSSFDKLPFIDNESVDIIYCCHALPYFHHTELPVVFEEWKRVLKPNGILRLSVTDFDQMIKVYKASGGDITKVRGPIMGYWKAGNLTIIQKTMFNNYSLTTLLKNCGFTNVKKWNWQEVEHGIYDDHSQAYYPHMDKENGIMISLNIQCTK